MTQKVALLTCFNMIFWYYSLRLSLIWTTL